MKQTKSMGLTLEQSNRSIVGSLQDEWQKRTRDGEHEAVGKRGHDDVGRHCAADSQHVGRHVQRCRPTNANIMEPCMHVAPNGCERRGARQKTTVTEMRGRTSAELLVSSSTTLRVQ